MLAPTPGTRFYTKAIVAAQMLAQIGAFALPALLPDYIARWDLSKTEAGWLVGIFFAAYVVMVPLLVALTDRVPVRRVYMLGTGLTALSHFGFALLADGFWSALLLRLLAGIGWAGTYMPGLKAIADPLGGTAQSRAVSWHAAGVGISGAASFAIAGLVGNWAGASASFLLGGATALGAVLIAATVMPSALPASATTAPSRRLLDLIAAAELGRSAHKVAVAEVGDGRSSGVPLAPGIMVGGAIGLLSGLTGTGGGIFLSPVLLFTGWARTRRTSGVSAVFILANSIAGLAGTTVTFAALPSGLPLWIVAALAGGVIGTQLGSRWLPVAVLRYLLAAVLVIAGLKLIFA